jgi:hypothetical protein
MKGWIYPPPPYQKIVLPRNRRRQKNKASASQRPACTAAETERPAAAAARGAKASWPPLNPWPKKGSGSGDWQWSERAEAAREKPRSAKSLVSREVSQVEKVPA